MILCSNLSGCFTLLFAYLTRVERVGASSVFAVLLSFAGATLVTLSDDHAASSSSSSSRDTFMLGDVMALLGAAGYGLYTVTIKLLVI